MAFFNSRIERLLSRTPGGHGGPSPGIARFIGMIPSEDRAVVRRWIAHVAADRTEPQPEAQTEAVDRQIVKQSDSSLLDDVREIVWTAKQWWTEHREHLAKSGMSCNLMGCR